MLHLAFCVLSTSKAGWWFSFSWGGHRPQLQKLCIYICVYICVYTCIYRQTNTQEKKTTTTQQKIHPKMRRMANERVWTRHVQLCCSRWGCAGLPLTCCIQLHSVLCSPRSVASLASCLLIHQESNDPEEEHGVPGEGSLGAGQLC